MPCCYFLHYFQLLGDPIFLLAPVFKYAKFLEQRFRLFCIQIQRYMRILHTFLLEIFGGIQRTEERDSRSAVESINFVPLSESRL